MPILIPDKIEPQNNIGSTHEDVFGRGGYVAIATNLSGSPNSTAVSQAINILIPPSRRKIGMLVFDASLSRNYRCTNIDSGQWTEVFANDGSIDLSGYVQRTELPSTGGVLDIASDTELAEFGLTALRVYSNGTTNLNISTVDAPNNSNVWLTTIVPANVATSTPAAIVFLLNTAAIGGTPGDPS